MSCRIVPGSIKTGRLEGPAEAVHAEADFGDRVRQWHREAMEDAQPRQDLSSWRELESPVEESENSEKALGTEAAA